MNMVGNASSEHGQKSQGMFNHSNSQKESGNSEWTARKQIAVSVVQDRNQC